MSRNRRWLGIVAGGVLILWVVGASLRQVAEEPQAVAKLATRANDEPPNAPIRMRAESPRPRKSGEGSSTDAAVGPLAAPAGTGPDSRDGRRDLVPATVGISQGDTAGVPLEMTPAHLRSAVHCWHANEIVSPHFHASIDRGIRTNGIASGSLTVDRRQPYPAQLFQIVDARPLRAKRVEFSADVRARRAGDSAGLRIRIYDEQGRLIAIKEELLKGPRDIDWTTLDVALDVPAEARAASYELIVRDAGQAWIDNGRIEVSDSAEVAKAEILSQARFLSDLTGTTNKPANLDFELEPGSVCE